MGDDEVRDFKVLRESAHYRLAIWRIKDGSVCIQRTRFGDSEQVNYFLLLEDEARKLREYLATSNKRLGATKT